MVEFYHESFDLKIHCVLLSNAEQMIRDTACECSTEFLFPFVEINENVILLIIMV